MQNTSDKLIDKVKALLAEADTEVKVAFFNAEVRSGFSPWDEQEVVEFKREMKEAGIAFEFVERYGGEDQGSDYWSVYSFSDGMQVVFIKFNGWYASYDGSTYEEFYEVKPVEKTITVFKKK
jgi:hypothetical protein